jgi:hypothetical protein
MEKPSGLFLANTANSGQKQRLEAREVVAEGVLSPAKKFCEVLAEGPEPPDCVIAPASLLNAWTCTAGSDLNLNETGIPVGTRLVIDRRTRDS